MGAENIDHGSVAIDPGSFRDPDSRVLVADDAVYRALSPRAADDWQALRASGLLERLTADGRLIATEVATREVPDEVLVGDVATVLRHQRIPFVSYPYEWTFGMLRDAALLQLDVLSAALEEGLILKDSSPYNVQFRGADPVFIDVGSFERHEPGEPWVGYRQFCMLYLYPLMLQALSDVPFQPWLRGSLDGITPGQMCGLLTGRARLRRGVTTHVRLHARLEQRYADRPREVRRELRRAGFSTEIVKANVRKMRRLVSRLRWDPGTTAWTGYRQDSTYGESEEARKIGFVRSAAERLRPALVWDLGANDGLYSRVAAEHSGYVVALDSDQASIEQLYRDLRTSGTDSILPLTCNLADPSPGLGWRGAERRPLGGRGRPGLVLALAVLHHLSITANVPLREIVGWLRSLDASLVVEFVTRQDRMTERLLAAKRAGLHADYETETFERLLADSFTVERREVLESGTRIMYLALPR